MKIKCLKCGHDQFMAAARYDSTTVEYNSEISKDHLCFENDKISNQQMKCLNCGMVYNLSEEKVFDALTDTRQPCAECGEMYDPADLDENGICPVCRLKQQDENFSSLIENATKEDLIRMLAMAQIENAKMSVENKVKKQRKTRKPKEEKEETEVINVDDTEEETSDVEILDGAMNPPEEEDE